MSPRTLSALGVCFVLLVGCSGMDGANEDSGAAADPVGGYSAQPQQIYVDGEGGDWTDLSVGHADEGDGENVGIERLWTAHSDEYLFLRIELSQAVNLQEDNSVTLHLDTDNNPGTGGKSGGVGADASWTFGERRGQVGKSEVGHAALGIHSLPTVQSDVFEIALSRSARPEGEALFPNDSLRLALTSDGDQLPDEDGGLGYVFTEATTEFRAPSIEQPPSADLRILSQNSVNNFDEERSAIFQEARQPSYRRIFAAVQPDVVAFQEVYSQTADEVASVTTNELGLSPDWEWAKQGRDLVLGSRFPLLDTHTISGYQEYESGAFLLDARSVLGRRLIVIVMHPPCCNYPAEEGDPSRNTQRQRVVDGVAAFLRDVTAGTGPFDVPSETPIAVVGDMNFVGSAQQPRTLRTGEIVHTDAFGPAAAPDWDGSPLLDTNPRQTSSPLHVTWTDPESSFPPGRLDYAFITDSVLDIVHEFVLNSAALSDEQRSANDLQSNDTATASDHLPVVVDLSSK